MLMSAWWQCLIGLALAVAMLGFAGGAGAEVLKGDAEPNQGVARAPQMPVQGIDVSQWQGDIDWRMVRAAGVRFAYIKATEGGDHLDAKFNDNWTGAKRAGMPRGAYHFVHWCRPAHEQALWFMLNVPPDVDALPPVLDLEWNAHLKTCPKRVQPDRALEMVRVLLAAMQAYTGKRPIIYTDAVFYAEVLRGSLGKQHFWLRSVAAEPHTLYRDRPWLFWQFTTTGRVAGIGGNVDRDVFNGPPADWDLFLRLMNAQR